MRAPVSGQVELALIVGLAALMVCGSGASSTAGPPAAGSNISRPGRPLLTYVAANGGVCLVRADGRHPVRVTARRKGLGTPAWSPRGRYVAVRRFTRHSVRYGTASKVVVADARGYVHWTFGAWDENGSPLWSPDGRHIVYRGAEFDGSSGFDVARPDGSDDHRVAECDAPPCPIPSWSADGQRLAFEGRVEPHSPLGSIFSTLADGSDRRLLAADAYQPAYSPTGSKLAYVHVDLDPSGQPISALFVADADGSNPRELTPPSADGVLGPTWSPDGRFLAFVEQLPCSKAPCNGTLVVARADGSGKPVVIAPRVPFDAPLRTGLMAWSPGGKLIAFMRGPSLVVVSSGGGRERVVVTRVGNVGVPSDGVSLGAWRPAVALPSAKRPRCPRR